MNNNGVPTHVLQQAARNMSRKGMGDFIEPSIEAIRPATSMPRPAGPADFPVQLGPQTLPNTVEGLLKAIYGVLQAIRQELVYQNTASRPSLRSQSVTDVGQTLTWEAVGIMDRLMIRNKGPDSCWYSYDTNGPNVNAFNPSDLSFELQANESVNVTHCLFYKIGVRCAGGKTATVHAQAFQSVAGNQAAAIS